MTAAVAALAVLVAIGSAIMTRWLCSAPALAPLDQPNDRSLHSRPTPRTGGLAILAGVALGVTIAEASGWVGVSFWKTADPARARTWLWVFGVTLVIAAVSFWDDRRNLHPAVRFCLHGMAATGVVWGGGVAVTAVSLPLAGELSLNDLAGPLTVLGLMWMANLYNFMDGMDGFAGGMTVLGFGTLGYLAWAGGVPDLAVLALLLSAAAAGFLIFNFPPARIFMGDVGSVPLGFLAGILAVLGMRDGLFDLMVPILVFSPFVVDATVTLFRRLARGAKVWQAHREHYYQRLVLAGWGHRRTVLAEYGMMLAAAVTAVLYVRVSEAVRVGMLVAWVVVYAVLGQVVRLSELNAGNRLDRA